MPSNTARLIEELKVQIDIGQADDNTTFEEMEELRRKLCSAFREEDLFQKQKSRNLWHQYGDRNTKFHHATTKLRRARNRIISLKEKNGVWVEDARGIERVATSYFQDLFSTSLPSDFDKSLRYITKKVPEVTNRLVTSDPTVEEIKRPYLIKIQTNPQDQMV